MLKNGIKTIRLLRLSLQKCWHLDKAACMGFHKEAKGYGQFTVFKKNPHAQSFHVW